MLVCIILRKFAVKYLILIYFGFIAGTYHQYDALQQMIHILRLQMYQAAWNLPSHQYQSGNPSLYNYSTTKVNQKTIVKDETNVMYDRLGGKQAGLNRNI